MRYLLTLSLLLLPLTPVLADSESRARAALALATTHISVDEYGVAYAKAIKDKTYLIVHVGIYRKDIADVAPDAVHVHVATLAGFQGTGLVIGEPDKGDLWWKADLPCGATVDEFRKVFDPPVPKTSWRAPIGHTHTCDNCGLTWDHIANPTHQCQNCGRSQYIIDGTYRMVQCPPQAAPVRQAPVRYNAPKAISAPCLRGG